MINKIILASKSEVRKEILKNNNITCEVIPSNVDEDMVKELKKQNKLMLKMIETQKETGKTEVRLDGRVISETVGENFYEIGNGL